MARRVSLPAADDLFRPTTAPEPESTEERRPAASTGDTSAEQTTGDTGPGQDETAPARGSHARAKRPSGRVRHDEKMTVYVTADELLDLEHARLMLRRDHGLAVDRGRLVREAVALALADLDARGEESVIVQRLKQV